MNHQLVYSKLNKQKHIDGIKKIYQQMYRYYEGVEEANITLLEEVFHEEWKMRDNDVPNESYLNVENKKTFLAGVMNHGPYKNYAVQREFVNVSIVYDKLSMVRVNKEPGMNSTIFFLFQLGDDWVIMDKIWVKEMMADSFAEQINEQNYSMVEQEIHSYYKAISRNNDEYLSELLDTKWDLKYISTNGSLYTKTKEEFLQELSIDTQYNYRLMSIEIYHSSLSIVRLDDPQKSVISYLTLFKKGDKWKFASERRVYK